MCCPIFQRAYVSANTIPGAMKRGRPTYGLRPTSGTPTSQYHGYRNAVFRQSSLVLYSGCMVHSPVSALTAFDLHI